MLVLLTVFSLSISLTIADVSPSVTITQGTLVGKYLYSTHGRRFSAFTGVPYAKPPIGDLRFKAPLPANPWEGVFNATEPHAICSQINAILNDYIVSGTEDCLYLNVYTPKIDKQNLLPVIFYIHGGGFMWGNANMNLHGPHHLVDKDVVIVAANYRLGALGFLSTGDDVVPGNNGLKDQNLALKWTFQNIEQFGGDPTQITVFGESAGGISTTYHMISPLSKDMVKRVIANSGSAFAWYSVSKNNENQINSQKLAKHFNCPINPSTSMVQCLQKIDASAIVEQEPTLYDWLYMPVIPFKPVIEPKSDGAFLTEDPLEIIKSGRAAKVPLLTGVTTEEGVLISAAAFSKSSNIDELKERFEDVMPKLVGYEKESGYETTNKIKDFCFSNGITKKSLTDCMTDSWFQEPAVKTAHLHRKYTKAPVYYYVFQYRGSRSFSEAFGTNEDYGVSHCDDLFYLVTTDMINDYHQHDEADKQMTDVMVNLWTNFVKTGNPTPSDSDLSVSTTWTPVETDHLESLTIKSASDLEMDQGMFSERIKFWTDLRMDVDKHQFNREEL